MNVLKCGNAFGVMLFTQACVRGGMLKFSEGKYNDMMSATNFQVI